MRRDLNVNFYIGTAEEGATLKNPGDFFREEGTGKLSVVAEDGTLSPLGDNVLYSARLSQTGTQAPTDTIIKDKRTTQNTWTRNGSGDYSLLLSDEDISQNISVSFTKGITTFQENINLNISYDGMNGGTFAIITTFGGTEQLDNILDNANILINIH